MTPTRVDREKAETVIRSLSPEQYVDEFVYDGDVEPLIAAVARGFADERVGALLSAAQRLSFVPLSERESGQASDYTQGMLAAARVVELMAHETPRS